MNTAVANIGRKAGITSSGWAALGAMARVTSAISRATQPPARIEREVTRWWRLLSILLGASAIGPDTRKIAPACVPASRDLGRRRISGSAETRRTRIRVCPRCHPAGDVD
ncbi:MAG: hypothetical protein NVS9B10_07450 [Nevskia sp.]